MNTEQLRADFEAWAIKERIAYRDEKHGVCFYNGERNSYWIGYQAGRSALQSKPNDQMLSAVIRMPYEMAMASEISRRQFYQRAQQAFNELGALQSQDRVDAERYRTLVESGDFTAGFGSSIWGLRMSGSVCSKQELDAAVDARRIEGEGE